MEFTGFGAVLVYISMLGALALIIIQSLQIRRLKVMLLLANQAVDRGLLEQQRQKDAAKAVVPYLAKTSVDMFYGEQEGVQYSFAQRQQISRKVQGQNTALRRFNDVFGIIPTAEAFARASVGDPEAKAYVEELGRDDDLPPASSSPWPVYPPRPEHHHPFA